MSPRSPARPRPPPPSPRSAHRPGCAARHSRRRSSASSASTCLSVSATSASASCARAAPRRPPAATPSKKAPILSSPAGRQGALPGIAKPSCALRLMPGIVNQGLGMAIGESPAIPISKPYAHLPRPLTLRFSFASRGRKRREAARGTTTRGSRHRRPSAPAHPGRQRQPATETKVVQRLAPESPTHGPCQPLDYGRPYSEWSREQRTDDGSLCHQLLPIAAIRCGPLALVDCMERERNGFTVYLCRYIENLVRPPESTQSSLHSSETTIFRLASFLIQNRPSANRILIANTGAPALRILRAKTEAVDGGRHAASTALLSAFMTLSLRSSSMIGAARKQTLLRAR